MMKTKRPSTSIKCFSPIMVHNKYNGKDYYVNCGKCPACLLTKSYILQHRVEDECKIRKFSVFFTLTYDNAHVPSFRVFSDSLGDYLYSEDTYISQVLSPTLYSDNGSLGFLPFLRNDNSEELRVGHLSKYDVQCFLKRLRINIDRKFPDYEKEEKTIRYGICGEYGPSTYRPHYHGIIWTDNEVIAESLFDLIPESWELADSYQTRKSISYVRDNASQYVAAYCNSVSSCPPYLQLKATKPFFICSKNPLIGTSDASIDEVEVSVDSGLFTISRYDEQERAIVHDEISPYMAYKCFPKCRNFDKLNFIQRIKIYSEDFERIRVSAFEKAKRKTSQGLSYIRLDVVDSVISSAKKFGFTRKDIMCKSKHIYTAACRYMKRFDKSLHEFILCVEKLYSHKALYRLKEQILLFNDLIFKKRYNELRYLYLENWQKASKDYLGNSGYMYVVRPDFRNNTTFLDRSYRDSILSSLRCGFDFYRSDCEPHDSKYFNYSCGSMFHRYYSYVMGNYTRRTKFKHINDSGLTGMFINS